ncbi:MAG: hypothetical protein FWE72_00820 [Spirochaetaceae bacterium]|nr:hypothetical protein [Spirochaetaceae bacterium]
MGWLNDFCNKYEWWRKEKLNSSLSLFLNSLYCTFRGWTPVFKVRMFLQKIFRKDHLNDFENWNCGSYIAKDILRRLRAYKRMNRHGYPVSFVEYEDSSMSMEEYNKRIESGEWEGGGPDAWEIVLDTMIISFEYIVEVDRHYGSKRAHEWYIKHYGMDPHDETNECNKMESWDHEIENDDGSSTNRCERVKTDGYTYKVSYCNYELEKYISEDQEYGLYLFSKYFQTIWD